MAETKNKEEAGEEPTDSDAGQGVEEALSQVKDAVDQIQADAESAAPARMDLPDLGATGGGDASNGIELLSDVDLRVTIELGRTEMLVEDVLKLGDGSVVELDKLAGDPVDVYVNSRLIARGEVLVLNDNFCIRVSEIVANVEDEAAAAQDEAGAISGDRRQKK